MTRLLKTLLLSMILLTSVAHSALLTFNLDGNVSGIKNMALNTNYGGDIFDIDFIDGSCIELISACSFDSSVFNFNAVAFWPSAGIRIALGSYLDTPELIEGCESTQSCNIYIPQGTYCCSFSLSGELLNVQSGPNNDIAYSTSNLGPLRDTDLRLDGNGTYALITLADDSPVVAASSPSILWLFVLALLSIVRLNTAKQDRHIWKDKAVFYEGYIRR